jgi:SAM-dependent methyltransferase
MITLENSVLSSYQNIGEIMFRKLLMKRVKILSGFYRTNIRREVQPYDARTWWDTEFFTRGISDRQTLSATKSPLAAAYHYASVELLILRHLRLVGFKLQTASVCDLGSGSGHWIDFYLSLGASRCVGIDVSQKSVSFLSERHASDDRVKVMPGRLHEVMRASNDQFELVNAIGVMFHLVDDEEWEETIRQVGRILRPGGLFVVGGHFGWLDNLNVDYDPQNSATKRLRSASHWRRSLSQAGFGRVRIYRNSAYLFIDEWIPENNIMIAARA